MAITKDDIIAAQKGKVPLNDIINKLLDHALVLIGMWENMGNKYYLCDQFKNPFVVVLNDHSIIVHLGKSYLPVHMFMMSIPDDLLYVEVGVSIVPGTKSYLVKCSLDSLNYDEIMQNVKEVDAFNMSLVNRNN